MAATPETKSDTYGRILHSALERFDDRGFGGTGIRDIATAAGLKTSALYHYMSTKEDLLFDMIQRGLTASLAACNEVVAGDEDPCRRLAALSTSAAIIHAEYRRTYRIIDNEFHFIRGETLARTLALRDEIDGIWQGTIEAGLAAAVFSVDDPHLARLSLLSMVRGVAQWYSPRGSQPQTVLATRLARMSLDLVRVEASVAERSVPAPDSWLMRRIVHVVKSTHSDVPV